MNNTAKISVMLVLLLTSAILHAYEIDTHDALSQKTAECSVMAQDAFMKGLGWVPIKKTGSDYTFVRELLTAGSSRSRSHTTQELIGWGAEYEDDIASIKRPLRHFFDPLRNEPLNAFGITLGLTDTSPNWATEDGKPAAGKKQQDITGQSNSFFDANKMMLDAASEPIKSKRKENWGMLFQTLGMVIHHIQDMAQPQHVRNDAHCNGKEEGVACYGFHNPSYYEKYTDGNRVSILGNFNCSSYPQLDLRFFSTARDFWLTENGNGRGMAEFTNRNFVSAGTNFRRSLFFNEIVADKKYPDPDPANNGAGPKVNKVDIQDLILEDPSLATTGLTLSGEIWFYETLVTDNYISNYTAPNERASTASLWNDKLERYNTIITGGVNVGAVVRVFNLNRFNFEAAYPFLFPRTIAYGAGLINHFFRGRLEVKDVIYVAGESLTFKIKNNTSKKNPGFAPFSFAEGSFTLYYDDNTGNRYNITSKVSDPSAMIFSGGKIFSDKDDFDVSFDLSGINNIDINKPFTLVFDGKIGNPVVLDQTKWERGIAVKTFSPQRLLAFDVSRSDGSALVPNIIDIYQSRDLGKSWQKVAEHPVAISDTTPDPGDRLAVNAVTYIGNGSLLLYPEYLNYSLSTSDPTGIRVIPLRLKEYGQQTGAKVPLDWNSLFAGFNNNISDFSATLRSLTYTGNNSLTALRMKHPLPSDPTPRSRQFQFVNVANWNNSPSVWTTSTDTVWANGGLPELSWQGGNNFVTSVYVEKKESADPNTLRFDSAIRRTVDRGANYSTLANFDECVRTATPRADEYCIQRIVAMDNNRLLGWVSQNGEDYLAKDTRGEVQLYLSLDNGANWSPYGIVPLPQGCSVGDLPYQTLDTLLYLGTKRPTAGIEEDTLFIESTCRKMILVNGKYSRFEEVGKKISVTTDSAATWTESVNPSHKEGRIIFAGDNGVVPDLFD